MRVDLQAATLLNFRWLLEARFRFENPKGIEPTEPVGEPATLGAVGDPENPAADSDTVTQEPGAVPAEPATTGGGFRSPATVNAFDRFTRVLVGNLEGEKRDQVEEAIAELRQKAEDVSAGDSRPYGHSIEHEIKKLLNDPAIKKAIRAAYEEMAEEPSALVPNPADPPETVIDQPVDSIDEAPSGAGRLSFSA
jgi:hypothetical protein